VILFDFDGVLVDSIDEMIFTGYNAVTGRIATEWEEIPPGFADLIRRFRYLIQPAGDMVPFAAWCLENASRASSPTLTAGLLTERIALEKDPIQERTAYFFDTRRKFVEKDFPRWVSLHRPFEPLWSTLQKFGAKRLVVLTNKNRRAVHDIFRHFALPVPEENLFSGDGGATKLENLRTIRSSHLSVHYHFVDDSLLNLEEMQGERAFEPLLAMWGYLGPDDAARASIRGIRTVTQGELIELL